VSGFKCNNNKKSGS